MLNQRTSLSPYLRCCLLSGLLFALPVAADTLAPDFSLPGRDQTVNLSAMRGKVVYVDFWASWCKPCQQSFPWMNRMQKQYREQGLVVVGINLDKSRELSDDFLKKIPANFTLAYDPDGKMATAYRVKGMPSSYLIDRQGRIQKTHIGFREETSGDMEAAIRALLEKQ